MGGEAVANVDNVADWDGAQRLIQTAVDTFGDLHVLVNNAGILRDRVHREHDRAGVGLRHPRPPEGPLLPDPLRRRLLAGADARPATRSRRRSSTRRRPRACSATRARPTTAPPSRGIATFSQICAMELQRYGVRSNAIAPAARTRLTEQTPGLQRGREGARGRVDVRRLGPGQRVPVRRLPRHRGLHRSTARRSSSRAASCSGSQPWTLSEKIDKGDRWTVAELAEQAAALVPPK